MAITKRDKEPTRAERKSKKRKLQEAIPDLPGDVGATDSQNAPTPVIERRENSSEKRKLGKSSIHDVDFQEDGENELQQEKNQGKEKGKRALKDSESHADEVVKSNDKASDSDHIGELRSVKMESIRRKLEREIQVSGDSATPIDEDPPAKSKKERKAERKAAEAAQSAASNNSALPLIEDSAVACGEEAPLRKLKKNIRNREKKRKGGNSNNVSEKAEGKVPRFIVFIGKLYGHFAYPYN
jgi:nucleolar protein 6